MKTAVLINGISARGGGGQEIFESFLNELLGDRKPKHTFLVVGARNGLGQARAADHVTVLDVPAALRRGPPLAAYYLAYLPSLVRTHSVGVILNFADLVIPTSTPQIYFFDWPYLLYPESPAWKRMNGVEYLSRRTKAYLISRQIRQPVLTLAQTDLMARRLRALYGSLRVEVIPSAVSPSRFAETARFDFGLPARKIKLLCLANYASHKNVELVLPLARLIKATGRPLTIVTTLGTDSARERRLLRAIGAERLGDCTVNVGTVEAARVPSLYSQCDALFFPTLLETFGLPFYEAMHFRKTIVTSNLDFARSACGDVAFYFDPFSAESALSAIVDAFSDEPRRLDRIRRGREKVLSMPDWPRVYQMIIDCIDKVCD